MLIAHNAATEGATRIERMLHMVAMATINYSILLTCVLSKTLLQSRQ